MIRLAVGMVCIAAIVGVLANVKQSGKIEERARVAKQAETQNATAQVARKRITADNSHGVLSRFFRD